MLHRYVTAIRLAESRRCGPWSIQYEKVSKQGSVTPLACRSVSGTATELPAPVLLVNQSHSQLGWVCVHANQC